VWENVMRIVMATAGQGGRAGPGERSTQAIWPGPCRQGFEGRPAARLFA
jgi:hypothetical protein